MRTAFKKGQLLLSRTAKSCLQKNKTKHLFGPSLAQEPAGDASGGSACSSAWLSSVQREGRQEGGPKRRAGTRQGRRPGGPACRAHVGAARKEGNGKLDRVTFSPFRKSMNE